MTPESCFNSDHRVAFHQGGVKGDNAAKVMRNAYVVSYHEEYLSHASDAELNLRFAFHHDADEEAVMAVMQMAMVMVETHRLRFIASSQMHMRAFHHITDDLAAFQQHSSHG